MNPSRRTADGVEGYENNEFHDDLGRNRARVNRTVVRQQAQVNNGRLILNHVSMLNGWRQTLKIPSGMRDGQSQ